MNKKFTDELISAFLDGEVTAEEKAFVEQQLVDSAEHRRTFEELRALRGSLQSLPTHELDDGFSERILRRAERVMLAGQQPLAKPESTDAIGVKAIQHDRGNWLVAVMVVSSVAVALFVSLFCLLLHDTMSMSDSANKVAKITNGPSPSLETDAASAEKPLRDLSLAVPDENTNGESSINYGLGGVTVGGGKSGDLKSELDLEESFERNAGKFRNSAVPTDAATPRPDQFNGEASAEILQKPAAMKRLLESQSSGGAGAGPSAVAGATKQATTTGDSAEGATSSSVANLALDATPDTARDSKVDATASNAWLSSDDRYVALLDVPREAFEKGALDEALSANGIQILSAQRKSAPSDAVADSPVRESVDAAPAAPPPPEVSFGGSQGESAKDHDRREYRQDVDVVFVEATLEQIASTFSKLEQDGYLLAQTVYREPGAGQVTGGYFELEQDNHLGRSESQQTNPRVVPESEARRRAMRRDWPVPDDAERESVKDKLNEFPAAHDAKAAATDPKPFAKGGENSEVGSEAAGREAPANLGIAVRVPKPQAPMQEFFKSLGQDSPSGESKGDAHSRTLTSPGAPNLATDKKGGAEPLRENGKQDVVAGDTDGAGLKGAGGFGGATKSPPVQSDKVRVVLVIRALSSRATNLSDQAPAGERADQPAPVDK